MLQGPDATSILRSFVARMGREPTLIELFRELSADPSGTPTEGAAAQNLAPREEHSPAFDAHLTAEMQLRELLLSLPMPKTARMQQLAGLFGGSMLPGAVGPFGKANDNDTRLRNPPGGGFPSFR